jgi:hypothetical protein
VHEARKLQLSIRLHNFEADVNEIFRRQTIEKAAKFTSTVPIIVRHHPIFSLAEAQKLVTTESIIDAV